MTTVKERLGCLENKVDRLDHKVDRLENRVTCIQEDLERFATKEDLSRELGQLRGDMKQQRRDLSTELSSHIGALHEWMATQFEILMEAMDSRLTVEQAEETFVKRSDCPEFRCP
jgi:hypothetical protein